MNTPEQNDDQLDTRELDTLSRALEAERERLRQRAEQYAQPVQQSELAPEDARSLLTFELGSEQYGVGVELVGGVRQTAKIVPVPGAPAFYPGVINVRGQIITVLDLRRFFGLIIAADAAAPSEVVLAQASGLRLGLLAHRIHGVETLPDSEIKAVEHLPYAYGITADRLIVLNLTQLFEDQGLIVGASE
jgi:purine-binding chemotaxis protein CheW